ncbi:uncharacterized protein [Ptychodera flava]|uniref:uncharacterized protein n=1 Tax=Ptychodera flava TaxID=63121 RepID=UPI00396A289D
MYQQQKRHSSTGPYSTARSSRSGATKTEERSSKVDPSFKSKRYRDKLREQIKALEALLPIDRTALHRKLDSQTVFRLVISYFRTKIFFQAARLSSPLSTKQASEKKEDPQENGPCTPRGTSPADDKRANGARQDVDFCKEMNSTLEGQLLLQALDGFLFVLTSDGTILYTSENIATHLGFNQVDLVHRCIYGIVHPDDHHELKVVLEHTLADPRRPDSQQSVYDVTNSECPDYKKVCFLVRLKCFNGTSTGYVKMQCNGTMRSFPEVVKPSSRTSCQVLFAVCRPFITMASDANIDVKKNVFSSKHDMDLRVKSVEDRVCDVTGFEPTQFEGKSFYEMVHLHDITTVYAWHKLLVDTSEINTMYFRMMKSDGTWVWLHTRGKVVYKNSRKFSVNMTHCPVREEDSSYLGQEAMMRSRYAIQELIKSKLPTEPEVSQDKYMSWTASCGGTKHKQFIEDGPLSLQMTASICPSSYHQSSDRHSPVFPSTYVYNRYQTRERPSMTRSKPFEPAVLQYQPMQTIHNQEVLQYDIFDYSHRQQYVNFPTKDKRLGFQYCPQQRLTHMPLEYYPNNHAMSPWQQQPEIKVEPPFTNYESYQASLTPQTSPDTVYHVQCHNPPMAHQVNNGTYPHAPLSPPPSPIALTTKQTQAHPMMNGNQFQNSEVRYPSYKRREHHRMSPYVKPQYVSHMNGGHGYHASRISDTNCYFFTQDSRDYQTDNMHNVPVEKNSKSCLYESACTIARDKYCQVRESSTNNLSPCHLATTTQNNNYLDAKTAAMSNGHCNHGDEQLTRASSLPPIGSFLDFLNEEMVSINGSV